MAKKEYTTTWFEIIKPKEFEKIFNPINKKFSIHLASVHAVEIMEDEIAKNENKNIGTVILEDTAHDESGIRRAINQKRIPQSVFHSLLCLLFCKFRTDKYKQQYNTQSVRDFIGTLKLIHNEPGSINKFENFFARLEIPDSFEGFEITVDEKWNFQTSDQRSDEVTKEYSGQSENHVFTDDNLKKIINKNREETGNTSKIPKRRIYYILGTIVSVLLLILIIIVVKKSDDYPKTTKKQNQEIRNNDFIPLFDEGDQRYKIMIVPFDVQCEHDGSLQNVGKVIELRLEDLNKIDTLNMNVRYVKDFISRKEKQDSTWTHYFKRIMEINNADHIIYGATREENCTSSNSDEICINYILNNTREFKSSNYTNNKFEVASLYDISAGKWQENIDFVIYMNAVFSIMDTRPKLGIRYLNKIVKSLTLSQENQLNVLYTRMQLNYSLGFIDIVPAHIDSERIRKIGSQRPIPIEMMVYAKIVGGDSTYIQDVNEWIKESPNNWKPFWLKAEFYQDRDSIISKENINISLKLVKKKKDKIKLYRTLGEWSIKSGNYSDALKWFNAGIEIGENYRLRYGRAKCYYQLKMYSEALPEINRALEIYNKDDGAHELKASLHLRFSEPKKALSSYQKALANTAIPFSGHFYAVEMIECNYYNESLILINEGIERATEEKDTTIYNLYILSRYLHSKRFGNQTQEVLDSIYLLQTDPSLLNYPSKIYPYLEN